MLLFSLPVGFACQACADLSSSEVEQGIASDDGAVCPDPGAGPKQSLKNTAVQRDAG